MKYLLVTICLIILAAVGVANESAPLVAATVTSVESLRLARYEQVGRTGGRQLTRPCLILKLQVRHDFHGALQPGEFTVAADVRAVYPATTWEPRAKQDAKLAGKAFLISFQSRSDGRFWLADKSVPQAGYYGYSTADVEQEFYCGEADRWVPLADTNFDSTLSPELQLCDLYVRNSIRDPRFTNRLIELAGDYRSAEAGDPAGASLRAWREYILAKFHQDESWKASASRGLYLQMLLLWKDPAVLEECKAEIRRDPNCTLFNGFPAVDDDELRLHVLRLAEPAVAMQLAEARQVDTWDRAMLRLALVRFGEDAKLDLKFLIAARDVTHDTGLIPQADPQTGQIANGELAACRERAKAAIGRYLGN